MLNRPMQESRAAGSVASSATRRASFSARTAPPNHSHRLWSRASSGSGTSGRWLKQFAAKPVAELHSVHVLMEHHGQPQTVAGKIRNRPCEDFRGAAMHERRPVIVSRAVRRMHPRFHVKGQRIGQRNFVNGQRPVAIHEPCSGSVAERRRRIDGIAHRVGVVKQGCVVFGGIESGPRCGGVRPQLAHLHDAIGDPLFRVRPSCPMLFAGRERQQAEGRSQRVPSSDP